MVRRLATITIRLFPVLLCAALMAGCGGDASSGVGIPPPPPPAGPVVNGTVRLPNGRLALSRSLMERFAALVVEEAEALTATNVRPVGRNVGVQLSQRRGDGAVQTFGTSFTNDQGQFLIDLPSGSSEDTCRFILSVGSGQTLTRAFVYSATDPIIVDFASETAVALILGQVQQGADLCEFSSGEIRQLVSSIRVLPGDVTGADVFATNRNALLAAANDPGIQDELARFGNAPTPIPTMTPQPPTATVPPTDTPTITVTPTVTLTRTRVSTSTATIPPSATPTRTKTVPASATSTRTATQTATKPPPSATPTRTPTVVDTATPTSTPVPTSTLTPTTQPTPTVTSTPAATPPQITIGSASGQPGSQVTVPISLTKNDTTIVTIAPLVIDTDLAVLTFGSCVSKVSGKNVDTGQPPSNPGRISITMSGSPSAVIPDGDIIDCTFTINAGASLNTSTPLTFVRAGMADVDLNDIDGAGTSGSVTVAGLVPTDTPTELPMPTATTMPEAPSTQLSSAIGATDTTLGVDDISALPDSGTVLIGQELITYNGKQAGTSSRAAAQPGMLLNVQRGVNGTTAAPHGAGDSVALVPAGASINVGSALGAPDSTVTIGVVLVTGGVQIAATSNDIVYDSTQVNVLLKGNGKPDCTINAAIGPDSNAGKSLSTSQPNSPASMKLLRIGVLSTENVNLIPDGVLFTCNFHIEAGASAGTKVLGNAPRASDAASNLVPVEGVDGSIAVVEQQSTPTPTPTQVLASAAINLDSASGAPGDVVAISATLAGAANQFAATSNDIVFDSTQVDVVLKGNGKPDCTINPAIDADSVAGKGLSTSLPPSPASMKVLRVGVLSTENVNPIPDGLLFTCKFHIDPNATPGVNTLKNTPRASDPASNLSNLSGTNGSVTVSAAAPTPTPTQVLNSAAINLDSVDGAPGDTVTISAKLAGATNQFAATSNDIVYDSTQVDVALKTNGKPDCTINPDINADSVAGKGLSTSQPPSPATAKVLRVGVLSTENVNPIPDGLLFTCKFKIAAAAAPGPHVLHNTPRASDPASNLSNLSGTDGVITVAGGEPTPTVTTPPEPTPTATQPAGGPAIDLGSGGGTPGSVVVISATLVNAGNQFAATSNDIVYDSTQVAVALKANGKPDCTINPDINADSLPGKTLSTSQPASPAAAKILRIGVLSTENVNAIPDGLLFTCKFNVDPGASQGVQVLHNTPRASDPSSTLFNLGGSNGSITVQ